MRAGEALLLSIAAAAHLRSRDLRDGSSRKEARLSGQLTRINSEDERERERESVCRTSMLLVSLIDSSNSSRWERKAETERERKGNQKAISEKDSYSLPLMMLPRLSR